MSATLDDMEPYEVFQHELDDFAHEYKKWLLHKESNLHGTHNQLALIHNFIEFACFYHTIDNYNSLTYPLVTVDFPQYVADTLAVPENSSEIVNTITNFLLFVYSKYQKGNLSLLQQLKSI